MFYERFLTLCKAKGMKPTAVADAIGISRMNASRWKNGTTLSFANIQKLADYFNVPVDYLVNRQEPTHTSPKSPNKVQQLISDADFESDKIMIEKLIEELETISRENRHDAAKEIKAFVQFTIQKYK